MSNPLQTIVWKIKYSIFERFTTRPRRAFFALTAYCGAGVDAVGDFFISISFGDGFGAAAVAIALSRRL